MFPEIALEHQPVLGCLAGDGTIEVLDDQNALMGPSVALRWQEVKGLSGCERRPSRRLLEERRDARRSLVEERKGRALERVDGAGWAQTTDPSATRATSGPRTRLLLELVSANAARNVFHPEARLRAAGLRSATRSGNVGRPQGRKGYPWQLPGRALGPRRAAVARRIYKVSASASSTISRRPRKARDDAVFDPRNPAYAYRGRAQPNIPRANSQPVHDTARRTAPVSSSLAPPPHGHVFPGERPASSPSGRALAVLLQMASPCRRRR